jgi:hypothetical protein
MASNAAGITVPPSGRAQLEVLLKHIDHAKEIIRKAQDVEPGITIFQVLRPLATKLAVNYSDLLDLFFALENLHRLEEEFGTASDALDRIISAVDQELANKIEENKSRMLEMLEAYKGNHPINITFKAQKLAYLHERIYREGEIITDVRPVFDATGEKVLEAIIGHTLTISFSRVGQNNERIHLALDAGDVLDLRKACDRAIIKAKTLQSSFASSDLNWKIHILRGEDDGTG